MKKLFIILTVLFGLVASVNAEAKSKYIRLTDCGYNEWYEITLTVYSESVNVLYYVPHYSDIEAKYKDDADLVMLFTFGKEIQQILAAFDKVLEVVPNNNINKDVAALTKEKRITIGFLPGGYVVVNVYFSDTDTFGTYLYK